MSELATIQEQPEATTTTVPAEQTGNEAVVQEETTTTTEQETTPVTIGGQVIVKNEDGTETHEVFPVTEVPAESAPAPEQTVNERPAVTEQAPASTEAAPATEPAVTIQGMPETELKTEAIAEVKPQAPETSNTNGIEAAPAAGLAGSLSLLVAAGIKRFRHGKKA